jgi:hypothetical protein
MHFPFHVRCQTPPPGGGLGGGGGGVWTHPPPGARARARETKKSRASASAGGLRTDQHFNTVTARRYLYLEYSLYQDYLKSVLIDICFSWCTSDAFFREYTPDPFFFLIKYQP